MEQRSHCESIELQKYPYHFQSKYRTKEVSKRIIISGTAKLFDPLGWIAEVIVNAKFMVQELWQRKTSWDEKVLEKIEKRWKSFRIKFHVLETLKYQDGYTNRTTLRTSYMYSVMDPKRLSR